MKKKKRERKGVHGRVTKMDAEEKKSTVEKKKNP